MHASRSDYQPHPVDAFTGDKFLDDLIKLVRYPEDSYFEVIPKGRHEYLVIGRAMAKNAMVNLQEDDCVSRDLRGQTLRFVGGPGSERYSRIESPGAAHYSRVSFHDKQVTITHIEAASERAYVMLGHILVFCRHNDPQLPPHRIDDKAMQKGMNLLSGRTVLTPRDAVEIFHAMHNPNGFEKSVRTVNLDSTPEP